MRLFSFAIFVSLVLVGCGSSSSGDDAAVKSGSGEITNPGGKPRNEQEAHQATAMQQQGNQMNAQRDEAAKAEAAARAAAGGK